MHIKVQNGTPSGGESTLCATCRCSTIVRGRTLDEELVVCSALGLRGVQILREKGWAPWADGN